MRARDKNLTVLSETEWLALYGLPDFDDFLTDIASAEAEASEEKDDEELGGES